jgi:hypothetical protein
MYFKLNYIWAVFMVVNKDKGGKTHYIAQSESWTIETNVYEAV